MNQLKVKDQLKVKELMILVERAVRPVCADISTKMKMREELYGHAEEIYRDEIRRGGDKSAALSSAMQRMGDPTELTAELQSTISWGERWGRYLNSFFDRRSGESRLHLAMRRALVSCLMVSLEIIPVLVLSAAEILHWTFHGQFLVRLLLGLLPIMAVNAFVFTLLGSALVEHLEAGFAGRRTVIACLGMALVASVAVLATGASFIFAVCGDAASVRALMPQWYALAALAAAGSVPICWLSAKEKRRSREWLELEWDT